jgi:hypothetical protein
MAKTYEPIATTTLGAAAASVTFSSISQSYTDLVLVAASTNTSAANQFLLRMGDGSVDTASNYSHVRLAGNGTSASSGTNSGTSMVVGDTGNPSIPSVNIINIMNYTNTTTFKTVLARVGEADIQLQAIVGLWRKTPEAINIITLTSGANNFATGSTFTLYGIKAA